MKKRQPEPSALTKEDRSARLIKLSEQKFEAFLKNQIGRTIPVLLLESKTDDYQDGLTDNEVPIRVTRGNGTPGKIIQVHVVDAAPTYLIGEEV
jgi:tRNA A37 methylthiotransferase MiaB